jgi:hypothetical protein
LLRGRDSIARGGIRALVCVPVAALGLPLGAIYADSRTPGSAFTELDVEILEALAAQAALAIAAVRLDEDVRRLLAELPERLDLAPPAQALLHAEIERTRMRWRIGAGAGKGAAGAAAGTVTVTAVDDLQREIAGGGLTSGPAERRPGEPTEEPAALPGAASAAGRPASAAVASGRPGGAPLLWRELLAAHGPAGGAPPP